MFVKEFDKMRNHDRYGEKNIAKFEKEFNDVISPLYYNWKDFTENELEILFKKFGNICRDETTVIKKVILSNND